MEVEVKLKNGETVKFTGDRVDVLDFENEGINYKQIRYFRKGFSKSVYIEKESIKNIMERP